MYLISQNSGYPTGQEQSAKIIQFPKANSNNEIKTDFSGTVYYGVEFRCNLTFSLVKPLTFYLLPVINWKFQKRWLINIRKTYITVR